jgi:glycosyltransferase involved in cell wall biosynthesis
MERFVGSDDIEFHIAGRGEYEADFRQIADRNPNCVWHGFVSGKDKDDLLASADVFLQISEYMENAPLSLVEAKQHGLYVIGTRIGGIPELVNSDAAGSLIPPADAENLSAVLSRLISRRDEIRSGKRARRLAQPRYGVKEMAERYVELYLEAAGAMRAELNPETCGQESAAAQCERASV